MTDNYAALLRQTAKAYRESLAAPDTDDMFTLAYQWQDKKHRHVWDLCKELERAADRIEKLEAALRECADQHVAIWSMAVREQKQGEIINPYSLSLIASTANEVARKALEGKDE